ncbi:low temperature requirement protein A [Williamsia deligens]|uniref:Low temperature requirement protein A n=1 Tax=Williamsia deligens TaxID=321325 RepID=A0ABW3G6Q4_9NOCA|nr:low temperature requirement protein A [Williamsia deligens]MCP2193066.1 Low temperature requirement protein LtrA [Williamsia deligens]
MTVDATPSVAHRLRRMTGRDHHEDGRTASDLELFFDLTFVVAFSVAGVQVAEYLAEGHYRTAIVGFLFASFSTIWAWINFSWFASAFDTDDWVFRVVTMVQMGGVLILSLGVASVFSSVDSGATIDNRVMVLGYVVMRVAMMVQWLRAATQSETYRRTCLTYAVAILVAQIGWVVVIVLEMALVPTLVATVVLVGVELAGPFVAERRMPTPWHPHHIAERYGLLAIITLGEGIVGTAVALQSVIAAQGWTVQTVVLGLAGIAITFSLWWIYFVVPTGDALERDRSKCFVWGYSHILVFMAIAAVGAGLHVAALYIEYHSEVGAAVVVTAVAVPLAVYFVMLTLTYSYLVEFDVLNAALTLGGLVVLGVAVAAAAAGVPLVYALVIAAVAPVGIVAVDEAVGTRRRAEALVRLRSS